MDATAPPPTTSASKAYTGFLEDFTPLPTKETAGVVVPESGSTRWDTLYNRYQPWAAKALSVAEQGLIRSGAIRERHQNGMRTLSAYVSAVAAARARAKHFEVVPLNGFSEDETKLYAAMVNKHEHLAVNCSQIEQVNNTVLAILHYYEQTVVPKESAEADGSEEARERYIGQYSDLLQLYIRMSEALKSIANRRSTWERHIEPMHKYLDATKHVSDEEPKTKELADTPSDHTESAPPATPRAKGAYCEFLDGFTPLPDIAAVRAVKLTPGNSRWNTLHETYLPLLRRTVRAAEQGLTRGGANRERNQNGIQILAAYDRAVAEANTRAKHFIVPPILGLSLDEHKMLQSMIKKYDEFVAVLPKIQTVYKTALAILHYYEETVVSAESAEAEGTSKARTIYIRQHSEFLRESVRLGEMLKSVAERRATWERHIDPMRAHLGMPKPEAAASSGGGVLSTLWSMFGSGAGRAPSASVGAPTAGPATSAGDDGKVDE